MSLISRFRKIAGLIEQSLYQISDRGRLVGEVVLGGMVLFIVADVILRYAFDQPMSYALELIEVALSLVVFFGLIMCTSRRGHIDIPVLVTRFSRQVQAATNSFVYFLGTGLFSVMAWRLFAHAMHVQQIGTVTTILKLPHYPFILVIALCSVLVTLLLLSQLIHFIVEAVSE